MTARIENHAPGRSQDRQARWAMLLVGLLAVAAHGRILGNGFVYYDTQLYVLENPQVLAGLGRESVAWAFSTFYAANWHPLTWLSHMLDVDVYGTLPFGHHLTNLLLHLGSVLLLFAALKRMTGAVWRSALAAALLAVHPVHVESVAWVAERKDVLSLFFGLWAMLAYARYVERPGLGRYLKVMLLLGLGLMAKPMLVTLPCVFLLLDYWPLGRVRGWGPAPAMAGREASARPARLLVAEKLPLLALAAASAAVTFIAQHHGGALMPVETMDFWQRAGNALTSYAAYLKLFLAPVELAAFYPLRTVPWWAAMEALLLVAGLTTLALGFRRRAPWAVTGWLWYLGTLVPVIGLVQVGGQSMADRYAYLPFIGLSVIAAWTLPALAARLTWPSPRSGARVLAVFAAAWVALLALVSMHQCGFWKDTETLFIHARDVTGDDRLIEGWIGDQLLENGEYEAAAEHFARMAAANPSDVIAQDKQGYAMLAMGRYEEAEAHFQAMLEAHPGRAKTLTYLGLCAWHLQRYGEAASYFETALASDPYYEKAQENLNRLRIFMQEQGLFEPGDPGSE